MALQRDTLELKPPKKFPIKNVRADLKTLFLRLSEAAVQGALIAPTAGGSFPNTVSAIFGAGEAVRLEHPPPELAWRLVRNGLTHALVELLDERQRSRPPYKGDFDHLSSRIEIQIAEQDVSISRSFFRNPTSISILPALKRNFVSWLRLVEVADKEAGSLANRLDSYFACALHDEWRAHRELYEPLHQYFETPFADALQTEADWERNRFRLIKQIEEPVFEETFSLRQVYVHLRAKYREPIAERARGRPGAPSDHEYRTIADDLDRLVQSWLDQPEDSRDAIRVVSGGPGCGKSCYAKHLGARLAESSRIRVLFVALQRFDMEEKLEDAIGTYLRRSGMFESNPLEQSDFASPQRPLLLLFDGLDELTKPGDLADQETARFVRRLNTALAQWNAAGRRVVALVTGRTAAVQSHRHALDLREPQVLTVLPYVLREIDFVGPKEILERDQRHEWWHLYAAAKDQEEGAIPEILLSNDLTELTAEPLLNYLVVLSGYHRKSIGGQRINRNGIYQELYQSVVRRRHAGTPLAAPREISDEEFDRLMETIAVTAWHGDGRTASLKEVEEECPENLKPALTKFMEQREHGASRLFAAFYFQQASGRPRSENAFEFTHKSFSEYLTARRMVREIGELNENLTHPGLRYSEDNALTDWCKLAGPQALTIDVLHFVRNEIALRDINDVIRWQAALLRLFDRTLLIGPAVEAFEEKNIRAIERKARNGEEALLAVLNACARVSIQRVRPAWRAATSLGELIHRLRGQRIWMPDESVALASLSYFEIDNQCLDFSDLIKADLTGSSLTDVNWSGTICHDAILAKTSFSNSEFDSVYLIDADLSQADLSGAVFMSGRLARANLSEADLTGANLSEADLTGANLSGADLSGANLSMANLTGVDLSTVKNLTRDQLDQACSDGRTKRRKT